MVDINFQLQIVKAHCFLPPPHVADMVSSMEYLYASVTVSLSVLLVRRLGIKLTRIKTRNNGLLEEIALGRHH